MKIYSTLLLFNTTFLILLLEVFPSTPRIRRKDDKGKKNDEGPSVRPTDLISEREKPSVAGQLIRHRNRKSYADPSDKERDKQKIVNSLLLHEEYLNERLENEAKRERGEPTYQKRGIAEKRDIESKLGQFMKVAELMSHSDLWPQWRSKVETLLRRQEELKEKLKTKTPEEEEELMISYLAGTHLGGHQSSLVTMKKNK